MTGMSHFSRALSDACSGFEALRPPNRVSISESAAKSLIIKQTGGGGGGNWDASETPYMVHPMNLLASRDFESLVFVGPARTGKTAALLLGWMAHTIVNDIGDMLFVQMSKDKARDFSKTDVGRALRNSPDLRKMQTGRIADANTYDVMFRHGMWLKIAWPTAKNLSGATFRFGAVTDLDRIENAENVDGEGPLFDMMKKRVQTFMSRGMVLAESSPGKLVSDAEWRPVPGSNEAPPVGGILGLYNRSNRNRWHWPCPHCREYHEAAPGLGLFNLPSFDQLVEEIRTIKIREMSERYGSRIVCPNNGCIIDVSEKASMNSKGIWLPAWTKIDEHGVITGEEEISATAGFWLGGVAATYQSWRSLVEEYLMGVREYATTGHEEKLKTTTNVDQGMPYTPRYIVEASNHKSAPEERVEELPRYVVDERTRCLLASVDVQGGARARFEVEIHAIGPDMEQWVVDRFAIKDSARPGVGTEFAPIDPASYPEDWDLLTEKVLRATWRTPTEGKEIQVVLATVDTGGEGKANGGEGVSHNAYDWFRRVRQQGMGSRVMLYKGASEPKAPMVRESLVGGTKGKNADVPLFTCNPHLLADAVFSALRRETPGMGYIHLPKPQTAAYPEGWVTQAYYDELLRAEMRGPNGVWARKRKANETFDLFKMIHAGMLRLGIDRVMDWNNVPAFLNPLPSNSMVITAEVRRAVQANTSIRPVEQPKPGTLAPRARRHSVASL